MINEDFNFKTNFQELKDYQINDTISDIVIGKLKKAIYIPTNSEVAVVIVDKNINLTNNLKLLIDCYKVIKHENFFQLYNIIYTTQALYLIFEYEEGENLLDYIIKEKIKFNEEESQKIFSEIFQAITYLKSMNIYHRNICLEKIFITKKKKIKILHSFYYNNFHEKEKLLSTPFKNIIYTPPEILRGENYNPELAEVWSLGILLFSFICGYLPFSFEIMKNDIILKIIEDEKKIIYPNYISENAKNLLSLMLKKDISERINFEGIKKHIWINSNVEAVNNINKISGINSLEYFQPVHLPIIDLIIKDYKLEKNFLIYSIIMNKHNFNSILYYLLAKKLNDNNKENSIVPYSIIYRGDDFEEFIKNKTNKIIEYKNISEYLSKYISINDFIEFEKKEILFDDINERKKILRKQKRETILTEMIGVVNEIGETNVQSKLKIFQNSKKKQTEINNIKINNSRKSKKSEIIKNIPKKSKLINESVSQYRKYHQLKIDNSINIELLFNLQINSEEIKTDNSIRYIDNPNDEIPLISINEINFELLKDRRNTFEIINFNYSFIKSCLLYKNNNKWNCNLQITNNSFEYMENKNKSDKLKGILKNNDENNLKLKFENFNNRSKFNNVLKKANIKKQNLNKSISLNKSKSKSKYESKKNRIKTHFKIVSKETYKSLLSEYNKYSLNSKIKLKKYEKLYKSEYSHSISLSNMTHKNKIKNRKLIDNNFIFCDISLCFLQDEKEIYKIIKDYLLLYQNNYYFFLSFENGLINFRSNLRIDFDIKFLSLELNIKKLSIFWRYGDYNISKDYIIKIIREIYNSIY